MVRRVAMVMVLGLSLINPIRAPAAADAGLADSDQAAIRTAVESQLAAFQRDDGAAAFSYAAPAIQEKFGTPENFEGYRVTGLLDRLRARLSPARGGVPRDRRPRGRADPGGSFGRSERHRLSCLLPDAAAAGRAMADRWLYSAAHRRSGDIKRALPLGAQDPQAARHFGASPTGEKPSAT